MSRILITGANGWIGAALGRAAVARGHAVWGVTRRPGTTPAGVTEWVHVGPDFVDLEGQWPPTQAFDVVLHLAARVHAMNDDPVTSKTAYFESNTNASLRVAQLARDRGVGRFVFLSSAKALGETDPGRPWREEDEAHPQDAYGQSKREAELALMHLGGIETVILRPPLVYGPGVRANFLRLLRVVQRGWPLPLGCANAKRSLISLDNLVDVLIQCASDVRAKGQLFHVADAETLSIRELVLRLGLLLQRPARLLPLPIAWLKGAALLAGLGPEIGRLTEPLRLDTHRVQETLDWRAPHSVDEALAGTVAWYLSAC